MNLNLPLNSFITSPFYHVFWTLLVDVPLKIIGGFNAGISYLTGGMVESTLFPGNKFSLNAVPALFKDFVALGIVIMFCLFVVNMIIMFIKEDEQMSKKLIGSIKSAFLSGSWCLMVIVMFFVMSFTMVGVQKFLSASMGLSDFSISKLIYAIGDKDFDWNNPNWNSISDFSCPESEDWQRFIICCFSGLLMVFVLFQMLSAIAQKVFEIYCYFAIAPIHAAFLIIDDGKRVKDFISIVWSKAMVVMVSYLAFILYSLVTPIMIEAIGNLNNNFWNGVLLRIVIIFGSGLALMDLPTQLSRLAGEVGGREEGRGKLRSMIGGLGGIAAGAGVALGIGKKAKERAALKNKNKRNIEKEFGGITSGNGGSSSLKRTIARRGGVVGLAGGAILGLGAATHHVKSAWQYRKNGGIKQTFAALKYNKAEKINNKLLSKNELKEKQIKKLQNSQEQMNKLSNYKDHADKLKNFNPKTHVYKYYDKHSKYKRNNKNNE